MSDVISVRLHLGGVRVLGVLIDTVERLEVEVESTRGWSRCQHCGFRRRKVWDRRVKRVRDLEVSGWRTVLVWRHRRFWCANCGERHLENHDQFQAGLTRRFARRLVEDVRVMSIRAASRHGVGWHRIMALVRAHSDRMAQRRRLRPTRVLLVDETSIRRRHRYVTVVACVDTKQVLAMIPGCTKGSLARFFRNQDHGGAEGWRSSCPTGPAPTKQPSPSICPTPATSWTASTWSAATPEGLPS